MSEPTLPRVNEDGAMPDSWFKKLDPEQDQSFREWARENWKVGDPINDLWHPTVRDECRIMQEEK